MPVKLSNTHSDRERASCLAEGSAFGCSAYHERRRETECLRRVELMKSADNSNDDGDDDGSAAVGNKCGGSCLQSRSRSSLASAAPSFSCRRSRAATTKTVAEGVARETRAWGRWGRRQNFALCLLEFHVSPSVAVRRHIASAATPAKRACVWRRERARACAYAEGAKTCKGTRRIPVVCGALSLSVSLWERQHAKRALQNQCDNHGIWLVALKEAAESGACGRCKKKIMFLIDKLIS